MRIRTSIIVGFGLLLGTLGFAAAGTAAQPGKRKPDPERGHDLYNQSCWACHGKTAEGDGPSASALSVSVPRLRGSFSTDGIPDLVTIVQTGRGPMPGFSETMERLDTRRIFIWIQSLDAPEASPGEPNDEPAPEKDGAPEEGN